MSPRRLLVLVVSMLVLAVALSAITAGLAVMVTTALPIALALGAALLTLVASGGTRLRRRTRRHSHRLPIRVDVADDEPDADARRSGPGTGEGAAPQLRWSTWWEGDPPVQAVPHTREQVAVVLAEWGLSGEPVEPTLLVVTELLSNAIDHAHGPVRLSVELSAETVHVEVRDATPHPPLLRPPDPMRARGRGMQFVEALSMRWGWTAAPPGKVVWADVPTRWPT
jgi:signal transduction histidine kinase